MRSRLVRLYPAGWRARYGDEFLALLEERPLGPFDVADILLGALDAQLRLRRVGAASTTGRSLSMSLRIGGLAAILGGVLWPLGFYTFAGSDGDATAIASIDLAAAALILVGGSLALLVALAGLTAFQARAHPALAWLAFALPAVGLIASVIGMIGMRFDEGLWGVWGLGTLLTFLGWILFAAITYRTAVLSRGGAILLGIGSILAMLAVMGVASLPIPAVVATFVGLAAGWLVLGFQAIRPARPAASQST